MNASIPSKQIGLISTKDGVNFAEFAVPEPGPNEVLIQNVAVASNPKDWKVPLWMQDYRGVEGNDVAGHIAKVGPGVTEYKGGERVAAFTKMRQQDERSGAYMQYSIAPASTTFPIPDSTTFEDAATLPLAVMTSTIGLFKRLDLPETPKGDERGVIINGASSSIGAYAVQLAKRAGLFVVGVAGSSAEYAKSLGADVIVDYREHKGDDIIKALVEAAKGHPVSHAFDGITENGSTLRLAKVLSQTSPDKKGKVTYVLSLSDEDAEQFPPGIAHERTGVNTAYGDDWEFAARWYRQIGRWLEASDSNPVPFKPNQARVLTGGLAAVEEGLALLKAGKVHAEKLVYRIAETPQLQK